MSNVVEELRRRQRDWLREIIARHGIAPTRLAKAAGLTPTTITRKVNDPSDTTILSEANVAKIVAYLGESAPVFFGSGVHDGASMALVNKHPGLREREAEPYMAALHDPLAQAIAQLTTRDGVDAWTLQSRALEYEGYRPGDILIVDLNALPRPGDVVCAQLYDWQRSAGTQTVFRIYEPPYLVAAGPDEATRKPRLIDSENVAVKGVVMTSVRPRGARAA